MIRDHVWVWSIDQQVGSQRAKKSYHDFFSLPPLCLNLCFLRPWWTLAGGFHNGWMWAVHSATSANKNRMDRGVADYVVRAVTKRVFLIEVDPAPWFDGNLRFGANFCWWNAIFNLERNLCCRHQDIGQSMNNAQNVLIEKLNSLKTALHMFIAHFKERQKRNGQWTHKKLLITSS